MSVPAELLYTIEHEWVSSETENRIKVGITDFAQSELGDIVFVDLPAVGKSFKEGEPFGSVESVKTVSELYSPVSGTVVSVNSDLESSPEKINEEPYGSGWMIELSVDGDLADYNLLHASKYSEVINNA